MVTEFFKDSGKKIVAIGRSKAKRDQAKIFSKVPANLKVIEFIGNEVDMIGYCYYFLCPEGVLHCEIYSMKSCEILEKLFPNPDLAAFHALEDVMEEAKVKIIQIKFPIKTNPKFSTTHTNEKNITKLLNHRIRMTKSLTQSKILTQFQRIA